MRTILAVDGGAYFHHFAYADAEVSRFITARLHVRQLATAPLESFDVVLLPCRMDPDALLPQRERLRAYLDTGGTVVSLNAEAAEEFLPGVTFTPAEVNFWWWLDPLADPGIRISRPTHPLFNHIRAGDVVWHYHGVLAPPPGAVSLVELEGRGSLLYVDRASTPGRLVISTLDPIFHHGSNFMPAATRLLHGLMPWLAEGDLGDAMVPTTAKSTAVAPQSAPGADAPPRCCA